MSPAERIAGYRLLAAAGAVPFRIVSQEILSAPDPAEFGIRIEIQFHAEGDDQDCDPEDVVEHAAFGFIFALAVLSFADARPREASIIDYVENDEFKPSDLLQCLTFKGGELHFYADYARGRRM